MPEEMPWADPVVVPDDIRSLQAEIDAYQREVRLIRDDRRDSRTAGNELQVRVEALLLEQAGLSCQEKAPGQT